MLILGNVFAGAVGNYYRDDFNLPNVESKHGFDILDDHFGGQGTGLIGTIVFKARQGVDDPQVRSAMERLFAKVARTKDVTKVESPYAEGAAAQQISKDRTIAYANV